MVEIVIWNPSPFLILLSSPTRGIDLGMPQTLFLPAGKETDRQLDRQTGSWTDRQAAACDLFLLYLPFIWPCLLQPFDMKGFWTTEVNNCLVIDGALLNIFTLTFGSHSYVHFPFCCTFWDSLLSLCCWFMLGSFCFWTVLSMYDIDTCDYCVVRLFISNMWERVLVWDFDSGLPAGSLPYWTFF